MSRLRSRALMMEPQADAFTSIFAAGELISHWKFDDAPGILVDSHGSNTLTNNGAVATTTGKLGQAADFVGSGSLSCASNASLQTGGINWLLACWVFMAQPGASRGTIASKDLGSNREYGLYIADDGASNVKIDTEIFASGSYVGGHSITGLTKDVWSFIMYGFDGTNYKLSIDGGAFSDQTFGATSSGTAAFHIGDNVFGGGHQYMQSAIDSFTFAKTAPTTALRDALYAGGAGLDYPF